MEHFNQAASTWDTPEKIQLNVTYANIVKKLLSGKKLFKILEIGCGTGLLGSQFLDKDTVLVGVDTSPGMLEIFRNKYPHNNNVKTVLKNLETDLLDENNFDLIISSMAFHHVLNPIKLLQKVKMLLNQNSIIAIIDLEEEDGSFHPDPKNMGVHHFGFSKETHQTWARELGLKIIDRQVVHVIEKNDKSYPVVLVVFANDIKT